MLGVLSAIKDGLSSSGPFSPRKIVFVIEGKDGAMLTGKTFPHMFNPVDYKIGRKVTWKCSAGDPGGNGGTQFYAFSSGQDTLSFSVVLDCSEEFGVDLLPEIEALYDLTYPFTKDLEEPSKSQMRAQLVQVLWGKFKFSGVVDSIDVTVNLFDPDGRMKRASVTVAMQGNAFNAVQPEDFFAKAGAIARTTHYDKAPLKDGSMDVSDPSQAEKLMAMVGI